jgi:hypothetical protein
MKNQRPPGVLRVYATGSERIQYPFIVDVFTALQRGLQH